MRAATIRLLAEALADRFSKVRSFAFVELLDHKTDAAATASNVVEVPERMSLAEAASLLPVATAHLTLARLAGVRPGQRVLVHSAAGGGGLAAVSVARWLGAEVYATAGSRRRRDFPREREIVHVGDSRTTVTVTGARLNVLAAIEHATRRVRILDAIAHPGSAWVSQATRNLAMDLEDAGRRIRHMIRDRDGKYPGMIDAIVADAGSTVVLSGIRVPWDEFDHGALDPVLPS